MKVKHAIIVIQEGVNNMLKMIHNNLLLLICPFIVFGQSNKAIIVKYLSAENVYINAGKTEGVNVEDIYSVIQNGEVVAEIEVVYTADHSASCKILKKFRDIQIGDHLKLLKKAETIPEQADVIIQKKTDQAVDTAKEEKKKPKMKGKTSVSGALGIQWYQFQDFSGSKLDYSQPTMRFNLRVRKLWNREMNIRVKFRSRYNERSRNYDNGTPQTEWRNRLYEASFSYDDISRPFNFKIGRIISNTFSGVGYIDGLQLQHNIAPNWCYGIFAGTQPEWQYSDFQTSIQKYGLFVNYKKGDYTTNRWESTVAFAGAYHGSTVSREFLYIQNSVNYRQRLNIYQSIELDLNRDWRKEKTGQSISMSGLYISSSFKVTEWLNTGLSYDNRKNYYTYEMRSLADSLFDDAFRHGIRANFSIRYLNNIRIYGNYGWRKRSGEGSNTQSYAAGVNASNFLIRRSSLSLRFAGFTNYYTTGFNPSIRFSKNLWGGHYFSLAYGNYFYTLKSSNANNVNQWASFNANFELPLNLYLSGSYEYDWGNDVEGQRILAELGYRF